MKKNNPFKVPNHYFDSFDAQLMKRIEDENTLVQKPVLSTKHSTMKQIRTWFIWAACFVGFGLGIQLFLSSLPGIHDAKNETLATASFESDALYYVDQGDLIDYLAENDDIPLK